ncbi:UNVERIFIED_CONTAM: hypothetical protein Scaly_0306100 [Sesamum calycinum]|uniref:Ovate family protein n=1 Tax=Sesamum calycinum TaxID=2727403 RepID=A0AAW2SBU2_9LAMI
MARNLNFCFTKIKSLSSPEHTLPENHGRPFSNSSPSLLIKNFNSLYDSFNAASDRHSTSESDTESPSATPDFATAFASQRFFFSSPAAPTPSSTRRPPPSPPHHPPPPHSTSTKTTPYPATASPSPPTRPTPSSTSAGPCRKWWRRVKSTT